MEKKVLNENKEFKDVEIIRMDNNENPYGTSEHVLKAVKDNIDFISNYPALNFPDLKTKIAQECSIESENISIAPGSVSFIDYMLKTFVSNDENVVIPKISFVAYKLLAERYDVPNKIAEMKNYKIDLEAVFALVDDKTRVVFLANPNNPTGTIFSHDEIYSILKKISPNVYVVIDEAYVEYVKDESFPKSLELFKEFNNVIVLRSFSKAYGLAGLRIGYAISHPENIAKLEKCRVPFSIINVASIAASQALDDKDFLEYSVENNSKQRAMLFQNLIDLGFKVVPSQGNFIFIHFKNCAQRDEIHNKLKLNGLYTKKMDQFGDEKSLRITVGNSHSNKKIIQTLS